MTGWAFTLHFPSYFPVMQFSENRPLRKQLYEAYVTRASGLSEQFGSGKAEWDNTNNMLSQLRLKDEEAKMLGFANFAALTQRAMGDATQGGERRKSLARDLESPLQGAWQFLARNCGARVRGRSAAAGRAAGLLRGACRQARRPRWPPRRGWIGSAAQAEQLR